MRPWNVFAKINGNERIKRSNLAKESSLLDPVKIYPNVEMESVQSRISQPEVFDPDDIDPDESGQDDRIHAMVATTETLQDGGSIPQRIRMSEMTELKEFSGKDRDEDRARS
uniref:Uncharacterized protein n=1 Tax=Peronospora matthiolae TaxID=2874970 RepID=A0AAV1TP38_9STRA